MQYLYSFKPLNYYLCLIFFYCSISMLSAQNTLLNDSILENKFYSHDVIMHEALARDSRLAFNNALAHRKLFLDTLFQDSILAQQYAYEKVRQAILTAHTQLRYNNITASSRYVTEAVQLSEAIQKDKSIVLDSTYYAVFAESYAIMALQYSFQNKQDLATQALNKAQIQYRKINAKQSVMSEAVQALLLYTQAKIALSRKQYMQAANLAKDAITSLEKYPKLSNAVWFLNFHKERFYIVRSQALALAKQPIDTILRPLQAALIHLSYDEHSRKNHLDSLRINKVKILDFNLPFDSIAHKVHAANIINYQMQLLHDWLPAQNEKVRQEYAPLAFKMAILLDGIINYTNTQFHNNYSHEELMTLYYKAYESSINIAYMCFELKKESTYLQYAAHWIDKMKFFLSQSTLHGENLGKFSGIEDELIDNYNQIEERVSYLEYLSLNFTGDSRKVYEEILATERVTLDKIITLFKEKYPRYYDLKFQSQLPALAEVSNLLDSTSIVLQFFEGPNFVFLLVIESDAVSLKRFDKTEYLSFIKPILHEVLNPTTSKETMEAKTYGYKTYNFYKKYLEEHIHEHIKNINIIADGNTFYLPFNAICYTIPADTTKTFAQLPYLIKKYNLSNHLSLSQWYNQKVNPKTPINAQMLGFAADYSKMRGINPLINNLKSLDTLDDRYRGDFYWGEDATAENFKRYAKYYGIIHLGLRGAKSKPANTSKLIFTNTDTTISEEVSLWDIQNLDMQAGLMVFNSLPSGYGQYVYAEDMIALYAGIMYSGANSLIAPLWETAQPNAPILMNFYKALQEPIHKDEALRKATIDYLANDTLTKNFQGHPYYWSSFLQVGDNTPLVPSERITIWWYLIPLLLIILLGMWVKNGFKQKRRF